MNRQKPFLLALLSCCIAFGAAGCSYKSGASAAASAPAAGETKAVPVEKILSDPDAWEGRTVRVEGVISKVESKLKFRLGCPDACVSMPVEYSGQPAKQTVVIQGRVEKRKDGKYVFVAGEIIPQE